MKLSVSLPAEDVDFIDEYVDRHGVESRSAVIHRAMRLLRAGELGEAYTLAWQELSSESDMWDATVADGINPGRD